MTWPNIVTELCCTVYSDRAESQFILLQMQNNHHRSFMSSSRSTSRMWGPTLNKTAVMMSILLDPSAYSFGSLCLLYLSPRVPFISSKNVSSMLHFLHGFCIQKPTFWISKVSSVYGSIQQYTAVYGETLNMIQKCSL